MQEGWLCPKCGRVNAPFMDHCDCVPKITYIPFVPYSPLPQFPNYPPWPYRPWDGTIVVTCTSAPIIQEGKI
jgi:hypothetical protein